MLSNTVIGSCEIFTTTLFQKMLETAASEI